MAVCRSTGIYASNGYRLFSQNSLNPAQCGKMKNTAMESNVVRVEGLERTAPHLKQNLVVLDASQFLSPAIALPPMDKQPIYRWPSDEMSSLLIF
jgi:hypothetical protein